MPKSLRALVAAELALAVDPRVSAIAESIAELHGPASLAVLFYGSCLRDREFDGRMLDFYLIVSDYRAAYDKRWLAAANRLIPPNVFYFEKDGLAAKYAVLSASDLARECGPGASNISVLARFAQPSRLVWAAGKEAEDQVIDAVCDCAPTLLRQARPLAPAAGLLDAWKLAFQKTFSSELRAERTDRSADIVESDPDRYLRFGEAAERIMGPLPDARAANGWWARMKAKGKLLSIVRLAKAAGTFAGGADYIAWKINRHAGTQIVLKAWQRRHPLLAGISLLPRLLKSGAIR